jgi:hypothetical protein
LLAERSEGKCLPTSAIAKVGTLLYFSVSQSLEADMLESNPPYALWSIWMYLGILPHLFFEALCVVGIYSIFSAAITMARLRAMTSLPQNEDIPSFQRGLAALHKRCTNVQWLIRATFYLFGFVLPIGFQWAYRTSRTPVGSIVLENFVIYFAFSANVFCVFFLIHCVQWFVSGRVDAYAARLITQRLA